MDPLIVHISQHYSNLEDLDLFVNLGALSTKQKKQITLLMKQFWPGPLTIVLPKSKNIPDIVTSGLPNVALRMPSHPIAQELLTELDFPLAAPSANRFGKISPTSAQDVYEELHGEIKLILDGGPCKIGIESTVLAILENTPPTVLRPGKVTKEDLENILKEPVLLIKNTSDTKTTPLMAPGILASHYAPKKSLFLLPEEFSELEKVVNKKAVSAVLITTNNKTKDKLLSKLSSLSLKLQEISHDENLEQIAVNLFSSLRKADASDCELILFQCDFSEEGLGFAIYDRLKKAAYKAT